MIYAYYTRKIEKSKEKYTNVSISLKDINWSDKIFGVAVIIVAVLGTVFFVFKKNQKNKTKTYPQDSVEYAAKELITDWFDAVISKDYDKYLRCCFPDEIKSRKH